MDSTFVVDATRVVHETVDDETIAIDLLTGTYYSITGCGVELWSSLAGGVAVGAAVKRVVESVDAPEDAARRVLAFVTELVDANLLEPGRPGSSPGVDSPSRDGQDRLVDPSRDDPLVDESASSGTEVGRRGTFVAPMLSRYTDMQALLLLDPVHEVDAAGWPHLPGA